LYVRIDRAPFCSARALSSPRAGRLADVGTFDITFSALIVAVDAKVLGRAVRRERHEVQTDDRIRG